MTAELTVEVKLFLRVLGQSLDNEVGVLERLVHINAVFKAVVGLLGAGDEGVKVDVGGVLHVRNESAANRAPIGLGGLEFGDIDVVQSLEFWLCALDGALTSEVDDDIETFVCGLISNLVAENTAANEDNIFNVHIIAS